MPYSVPGSPDQLTNAHQQSRPTRSSFSDERGPGAFVSLGSLPKRRPPSSFTMPKGPVFHFKQDCGDDEDGSPPSEQDEDDLGEPPPLKLKSKHPWPLSLNTNLPPHLHRLPQLSPPTHVPFPLSSPISPTHGIPPREPFPNSPSSPSHIRPEAPRRRSTTTSFSRSTSASVLSNGKPLKSSLKSSSSAPSIPESHPPLHIRAQSAPSTPNFPPKNVHFPETDGLESIRLFSSSAKPLSITTGGDDTETETEPETTNGLSALGLMGRDSYPFPRVTAAKPTFALDLTTPGATSAVPAPSLSPYANVYLESLRLEHTSARQQAPILTGTLVVRNLAFTKHVAVRFTMDEWQTTSEVSAWHVISLDALPPALRQRTLGDASSASSAEKEHEVWDRFQFNIRLEDFAHKLQDKVMWLAARFTVGESAEQWWDNNSGQNYRVAFCVKNEETAGMARRHVLSAPAAISRTSQMAQPSIARVSASGSIPTMPSPPYSNGTPSPISPPSPEYRAAILSSTTSRLAKMNLRNYCAPHPDTSPATGRSPSANGHLPTPPLSPDEQHLGQTMLSGLPSGLSITTTLRGAAGAGNGYGNHVRGGSGIHLAMKPPTDSLSIEEAAGSDVPNGEYTCPQNVRPPFPKQKTISPPSSRSDSGSSSSSTSSSPAASPPRDVTMTLPRPSPPSARGGPKPLISDTIYDALVQKWCFVQGSPPLDANLPLHHSHHHHPGATGLTIDGVV